MTHVKVNEGESVIDVLLEGRELINGDVLELYEDEEVLRLFRKEQELKDDLKKVQEVIKLVDAEAIKRLRRRKIDKAENETMAITLVSYTQRSIDKDKLGEWLSTQGKTMQEFEKEKPIEYIKRKLK